MRRVERTEKPIWDGMKVKDGEYVQGDELKLKDGDWRNCRDETD